MRVLLLDGYNLMHRARHSMSRGFAGDDVIVYSFFRSLRPLIEKFAPDKAYFVIEGYPRQRLEMAPDYKATRVRHDDDGFQAQKKKIVDLLKSNFPLTVVQHGDYECDDVLANLIKHKHSEDDCTVVSSDSDFFQLYNHHSNVQVYNPVRKAVMPAPEYDYVTWKALRGDGADNIPGFRGIGDKRATNLVLNKVALMDFLRKDESYPILFEKNKMLIRFHDMESEMKNIIYWDDCGSWEDVKRVFDEMEFFSITNDRSWKKFAGTFASLQLT
ncbi:MAG TPA: hypothetical protein EYG51_16770 [Pseudomonadales bacterium]|nr:hypothetical protein [Pseudomonadales bacterium]